MTKVHHSRALSMTEGSLGRGILLFAIPLMLTSVLQLLYNSADMIVVGQFEGKVAVGAIGSTTSLLNLFINLVVGFGTGASICLAHRLGAGLHREAGEFVHTSVATAIVAGLFVGIVGFFLSPAILSLMDTEPTYLADATLYLRVLFCGFPAQMLYNFASAIIRTTGDTRRPFLYLAVSGALNVGLNLVFVAALRLGVLGVAIATISSQYLSALLAVRHLSVVFPEGHPCHLTLRAVRFHRARLYAILGYGIPIALQSSMFSISNVLLQSAVNAFGADAVSGSAAASSLSDYAYVCMNAFAQAASVFVGQNVGARKKRRVRRTVWLSILYGIAAGLITATVMICFAHPLLSIFLPGEEEAILYAKQKLYFLAGPYFLCIIMDVFSLSARSMGSKLYPLAVSVLGVCGFRIFWIYAVLPYLCSLFPDNPYLGFGMIFLSYPVSWILTGLFQFFGMLRHYRKLPSESQPSA